jgi:hypothetical protein
MVSGLRFAPEIWNTKQKCRPFSRGFGIHIIVDEACKNKLFLLVIFEGSKDQSRLPRMGVAFKKKWTSP